MQCLIFRLYGPLASWGVTAIGGVRSSASMPTRSAIIGLVGAALGIRRDEEDKLDALSRSITVAVKAESEGTSLRDYHTAQTPSVEKKALWTHRKAELEFASNVNTVLSSRDYRADGHWLVGLVGNANASYPLEDIYAALQSPVFPLYLGRNRACWARR
jgi:CRISPR system Cascade subunit CasD